MSSDRYWPRPPRLVDSSDPNALVRWHLRLAIISEEDGQATTLANKLGVTPNTLHLAVHRGTCTLDLAKRIEKHYGREYFPREVFLPDYDPAVE
jgi:hypothetical protein